VRLAPLSDSVATIIPTLLFVACAQLPSGGDGNLEDTYGAAAETAADSGNASACGWEQRDPGTLASTGNKEGDVLANLDLIDQCGESFRVWDMYEEYFLLFVTGAW
jgi:hypothetical protein